MKADTQKSIIANYELLLEVWEENYVHVEMRSRIRDAASYMVKYDFNFECVLGETILRRNDWQGHYKHEACQQVLAKEWHR